MSNVALTTRDGFANVAVTTRVETPVAPEITTTALPAGTVGVVYNQTIQVTGTAPITCTIQSGSLPPELTLNETTRQITGPALATPGLYEFTVRAENAAGSDDQLLSILVPNEGSGGTAPMVTTVTLVPVSASLNPGNTTDLVATVEDNNGDPIPNLVADSVDSTIEASATGAQLAVTDASGQSTIRVTGIAAGEPQISVTFDGVRSNYATVTVFQPAVTGTLDYTEPEDDTFEAVGQVLIQGIMAEVEVGDDVFEAVGILGIRGTMAYVEPSDDTFAAVGFVAGTVMPEPGRSSTARVRVRTSRGMQTDFDPKHPAETELFAFNMSRRLGTSEVLASATVEVFLESDSTQTPIPEMLDGSAVISGDRVLARITGGEDGKVYTLICTATTASGQVLVEMRDLPVLANLTLD